MAKQSKPLQVGNPLINQAMAAGLSRTDVILIFVLPNLRSLATLLAARDENTTGADDDAARATLVAITALETYLNK